MLSPGRAGEFVGSPPQQQQSPPPPPPQIGGNSSPYYHHGITYAHVDPLSTGLNRTYSNKAGKKSLASRISNQLGRFKSRSSSADKSQSRIVNHVPNPQQQQQQQQQPVDGFSPHFRPRRTFYNVLPPREMVRASGSMRGPSSRRYFVHPPVSASVTPSWAAKDSANSNGGGQPQFHHHHHRPPMCIDLDNTVAINGNVCLCEGLENHNGGRLCRRCGLERQAVKAKVESWWKDWISTDPMTTKSGQKATSSKNNVADLMMIKRSQSEESVSTTNNPYEAMRKQRLSASTNMQGGRYVSGWERNNLEDSEESTSEPDHEADQADDDNGGSEIDEEDKARAYAEVDMIYNSVRRRGPPAPPGMFQPSPYMIHQHVHTHAAEQHQQPPSRLQRSSSSVIRRSIILKTPTSTTGKRLPTPPRNNGTPTTISSSNNIPTNIMMQQSKSAKSSSTAASVYVAPTEPQPNNTVVKINMHDSESSAKDDSSSEVEDEINGIIENGSSTMTAGGGATTIVDQGTKMKQLQLRNLKRLREKVKEEEEKLRALKSAAAKIKESSSSSSNAGGGGAGGVGSSSIGENDEDYDADCSAMESTPLKNKLMSNHNNNTTTQPSIVGNGNRRTNNNINNSSLQRNNASGHVISAATPPVDYADSSKLMQLYHRRKRQQELQIRSEFNPGDMQLDIMTGKDNSNVLMKDEVNGAKHSHLFNDTTRIRMNTTRPSVKEAFNVSRLGRRGISQSFKEKAGGSASSLTSTPTRPKDPPPPPPPSSASTSTNNMKLNRSISSSSKIIYDIAENDEDCSIGSTPGGLVILHTNNGGDGHSPQAMCSSLRRKNSSAPSKPPRQRKARSQSFTPSSSKNSDHLFGRGSPEPPRAKSFEDAGLDENGISSLVTVVGTQNTTSSTSASTSTGASNHSLSSDEVVKEDKNNHIYEEIPAATSKPSSSSSSRPLPPIPKNSVVSTTSTVVSVSSKLSSLKAQIDEEDVKSIFVGATKYEILHYLEDAKERGVDALQDDAENENEAENVQLADRNHANRVSQFSNDSKYSNSSSNGSSTIIIQHNKDKWTTSVEIERNDSGLGSETGKSGKRPVKIRDKLNNNNKTVGELHICEDCDQPIEESAATKSDEVFDTNGPTCLSCAKRRCERKEIITEIIETEIKYGRDLRIILEEFYRPMQVAGLLSQEQLSAVFLNVEELVEVNRHFTETLRDAIEIALDEGDEDLCTVKIGQLFKDAEPMLGAFKSYCTRQGSSSALLAALEKERELLRIFLRVSQMENTILRRMNLSSFLMVPVQRVTKYPLLLSRLLKVTPAHHEDRGALQESRERIEHHLENMNQEARDTNSTRLWRRISMINVSSYRKMDSQLDVLGNTTWGIRKMALDVLQWTNKSREDVNFVLEGKLQFTQATEANWRRWNVKMTPVSALLVTLGRNSLEPPSSLQDDGTLNFPVETGVVEAALLLIREKNNRFSMIKDPVFLGNCIICWEQDWDDCFEVHEFSNTKESLIFKGEDVSRTRQWFKALQFYGLSLGNWRRRRNGMANIMIYGTSSTNASKTMSSPMTNTEASKSTSALFVPKSSSLSQLVDLSP